MEYSDNHNNNNDNNKVLPRILRSLEENLKYFHENDTVFIYLRHSIP